MTDELIKLPEEGDTACDRSVSKEGRIIKDTSLSWLDSIDVSQIKLNPNCKPYNPYDTELFWVTSCDGSLSFPIYLGPT